MTGRLIYLASYPKSGNTWLRAMLFAYMHHDQAIDINAIDIAPYAADRATIDRIAGLRLTDLPAADANQMRYAVLDHLGRKQGHRLFFKVHEANLPQTDGSLSFTAASVHVALYPIRHPYDVAVSFAHHLGRALDMDTVVSIMCDPDYRMSRQAAHRFSQIIADWGSNVRSWTMQAGITCMPLRYEDMLLDPATALRQAVVACWPETAVDEVALQHAIAQTQFSKLQQQEKVASFSERPTPATRFFRTGLAGEGAAILNLAQRDRLWDAHRSVMQSFGYRRDGSIDAAPLHHPIPTCPA